MGIQIDNPTEIWGEGEDGKSYSFGRVVGARLITFQVLPDPKDKYEEPACADEEILMEFDNGKEMRIYIEDGKLRVYTD